MKITSVVGARPSLMKVSAICHAIEEFNSLTLGTGIQHTVVHTGEYNDTLVAGSFFNDLDLPKPDFFLGVGSGSHAVQTARIMEAFETVLISERPDVVLVIGDVNSALACALVTKKIILENKAGDGNYTPKLAHVEAGLRSFDRSIPEEINRLVTDSVSDYLFTTEESANKNLLNEGVNAERVFFVGNVMIDTLLCQRQRAQDSTILRDLQLDTPSGVKPYVLLTVHRAANVDDARVLSRILDTFLEIAKSMPVIFPAHPRTLKRIQDADLGDDIVDHYMEAPERWDSRVRIRSIPPLGYIDFVRLMSEAQAVFTDSDGIQEETTILGVPCVTLRENTERSVTVLQGTNVLVGSDSSLLMREFIKICQGKPKRLPSPLYWDGHAATRIVKILVDEFCTERRSLNDKRGVVSNSMSGIRVQS